MLDQKQGLKKDKKNGTQSEEEEAIHEWVITLRPGKEVQVLATP